ncbi:MAG: CHAT domain-containing protein [Chloroflexi bacterium]|nr:CHAT domain-containing protein [Chloroflexota bacterium]
MSYQNFAVEVAALPNGKYRISMQSPVGEASADVDSPFTPDEINNYLQILAREKRVSRQEELKAARDFGERLFVFLFRFSTEISSAYFASLRDVGTHDGLRIRLSVDKAGPLSQLPWEFLRDPVNDFLALSRRTPIVRYTQQLNVRPPAAINMPLRVLVMISAPKDFPELDVEGEWQRLQEATAPLRDRGVLELERLDTATLIALQRRLRAEDYHIFHFIGHSDYDAASQQGVIVFENEKDNDKAQIISGTALSRELAEESTVRLVVLNSCHSANRPDADVLAGISSSIVARGIPAVAAMQFNISDGAAKAFAEEFYRSIAELIPLDAAMSEARRAISNRVGNNEWATPVLYMRADDGVLFQTATIPAVKVTPDDPNDRPPVTTSERATNRAVLFGLLAVLIVLLAIIFGLAQALFFPAPVTPTATILPALLPDLQIGTIRVSPRNPAPGQIFILSIPITNAGKADSGPFNWVWDASLGDPVLLNSLDGHIDNIPPGVSKNISFPFTYGWWGTYNSQLNVDVDSQVVESDDRNNRKPFEVTMARLPFDVDFSRLPSNQLVNPPMTLDAHQFDNWNLKFAVNAAVNAACAAAPLVLKDQSNDLFLSIGGDNSDCTTLPLTITIQRGPVSTAVAEIIPIADGTATFTYFADENGQQPIFQSPVINLQAGIIAQLAPADTTARLIHRIEISVPNQTIQLTRLTLTPTEP